MTNEIFSLECAGIKCWDVYTRNGRYAGLIVTRQDGTLRHYYNTNGTKGSSRKLKNIEEALDSIRARRDRLVAKRGQQ